MTEKVCSLHHLKMQPPHPLMLEPVQVFHEYSDKVLEVLFDKCDFETLKTTRQVCKHWLSISSSAFSRKSVVNFYSMYPETYVDLMSSIESGFEFMPLNVALTLSPVYGEPMYFNRNLTVCPWHACEECIFPFGNSIESLKFYAWDSTSDRLNAPLFSQILLTPIYLRSLEISLLPSAIASHPLFPHPWKCQPPLCHLKTLIMYGKVECTQEFLYNFLSAMPNLSYITVNCCSCDFLDLFCATLHQASLRIVQHLKLNFVSSFTDTQIQNIKKANLPLKTLHMAPRSWVTNFNEYTKLLAQLSPTLEDAKLTICTRVTNFEQFITVPCMPKLKCLRLQSWRGGPGVWKISFINNLPNLECLIMERRGLFAPIQTLDQQITCFLDEKDVVVHEKLQNLVLPSMPMLFPDQACLSGLLVKLFRISKLTLSANDSCLECVFKYVPNLEELTIAEYSKITDDGITGLVSGDLMQGDEIISYNVKLGITALKDLKRLELDGFWGNVTDFSIFHGIMHLDKLDTVVLRGCKISEWGRKTLSKKQLTVVGHDTFHIFEPEQPEDIVI